MTGLPALAGLALAVPFTLGFLATPDGGHVAFRFQDRAITESSGLVVDGDLLYTTNDSGDSGRVFAVDRRTGETVGVTHWADDPKDVEALAPAGPGEVWVGDLGDNGADRHDVEVSRIPVGRGERTVDEETYELTYPDGPVDAETLLADPATGRLYVVSKQVFSSTVYAAPEVLSPDGPNVLEPVGTAPGIATDGAFLPDGGHLIIRSYEGAAVYAWPSLARVATLTLPSQTQGEGLAVAPDDTLWLSSEGIHAPVLHLDLPAGVRRAMAAPTLPGTAPASPAAADPPDRDVWPWLVGGVLFLGAIGVLIRSLRPR